MIELAKKDEYVRGKEWLKRMKGWSLQKRMERTAELMKRLGVARAPPKGAKLITEDKRDKMSKNGCAICGRNDTLYDSGDIYVCQDCLDKMKVRSGHNFIVQRSFYPVYPVQCNVCKKKFGIYGGAGVRLMHVVRANVCRRCMYWLGSSGQGRFYIPRRLL